MAVVVSVKEAALLLAMDRIVGRVEVEYRFERRLIVRFEKQVHQKLLHAVGIQADSAVPFYGRKIGMR